jgi:cytochrome o ubiquinol oxidase operon protein cyoD
MSDKTLRSYVIGFGLSLVFTLIPYYLVVNHRVTGTTLLMTIMSFALVQLIVQITFFLHLGRGPAPRWNLYFFVGTVGVILIVVGGSIVIINNLHRNSVPLDQTRRIIDNEGIYQVGGKKTGACHTVLMNHVITIKNGMTDPILTIAGQCDTLTFINNTGAGLEISFGTQHLSKLYAGLSAISVPKDHSKTITLSELGTYQFHNQLQPAMTGSFAVVNNN